ncbi:MAG: hypothetical protein Q9160_001251 [Pyrenula sp. 1 TL-2023]
MERKTFTLPPTSDFHVHLRDGAMMELVTPTIPDGGVDTVYVMPNLIPPLTELKPVQTYHSLLHALSPTTHFLMTLYLHPTLTPSTLTSAASSLPQIIHGVKAYPAGVTTNSSSSGLTSLLSTPFPSTPLSTLSQPHPHPSSPNRRQTRNQSLLTLNLHGESPSPASTILSAEPDFLPTLHALHAQYPTLRIVLEHCTTAAALDAVRSCGENVTGTITAHHLWLTLGEVVGSSANYCKPVAKGEGDRRALCRAVVERGSRFFFGSDSAPHPLSSKLVTKSAAAGCFTQPWATQLVIGAMEEAVRKGWVTEDEVTEEALTEFLSARGRRFYGLEEHGEKGRKIKLEKKGERIPAMMEGREGLKVEPFRAGEEVWSLEWVGGEGEDGGKGKVEQVVEAALGD